MNGHTMRIRITFSKTGSLRYAGHLDLHQIWERTARRARLPLAYTQGFHPGPKIQIAAALPLGFSGRAEALDMWLEMESGDPGRGIMERLQSAAPPGLTILSIETVDGSAAPLQTRVDAAEYEVTLLEPPAPGLDRRLAALMAAASLPRVRRGKPYDLRPLILSLSLSPVSSRGAPVGLPEEKGSGMMVSMRLAARAGATGRPEEVLAALDIPLETARIERTCLIFLQ